MRSMYKPMAMVRVGRASTMAEGPGAMLMIGVSVPIWRERLRSGVAEAKAIDLAMTTGTNHPAGPLALADRIGLDTVLAICEVLHQDLGEPKFRPCPLLRRYVEAGWLGKKSGRGFYVYDEPSSFTEASALHTKAET